MSQRPPVVIELYGPVPPPGKQWCATCAMLYLGDVSANIENQDIARHKVQRAEQDGEDLVELVMDASMTWRTLRISVTIAPSVYFQVPMPVCWVHMQGYDPEAKPSQETLVNNRKGHRQ